MNDDDTAEFKVLSQANPVTGVLSLLVASFPPVIQATHWRCLEKGLYKLVDIIPDPSKKGVLYRIFLLSEPGHARLADLKRMDAQSKILDPGGNRLQ